MSAEQRKEVEWFAGLEEGLGELNRMLRINVVVGEAVDEQERSVQIRSEGQHAALAITVRVFRWEAEITLGVMRVVIFPRDDRRAGDRAAKNLRLLHHSHR